MSKKRIKKSDINGRVLKKRINNLEDQLKRALADYQNLSKRIEQKQGEWRSNAVARVMDKLLDVYNDLRRAKENINDPGLSMAVDQLWAILASEGVDEIKTKNADFDPETMDCVGVVKGKENKVIETLTKGYLLDNKVIRPAKVKVGQGKIN